MDDASNLIYIIDASFILAFLLPDEKSKDITEVFEKYRQKTINFASSVILHLEVMNGLKYAMKAKRIDRRVAESLLERFLAFDITILETDPKDIFALSLHKDISVYDASYVLLAKKRHLPFLTLDKQLKRLSL